MAPIRMKSGPGQERGEGRGEGAPAADGQAGGGGHQLLFGLARGHLVADGVPGQGRVGPDRRELPVRGRGGGGERAADHQVADAAELGDRAGGHVRRERLAVPAVAVLDLGEPLALDGPGQDHRGLLTAGVAGGGQGLVDGGQVVAVDLQGAGAEGFGAAA
jgi:hypothetical protein